MNPSNRLLGLELIEDRCLPSVTFISFNSGYADYDHVARYNHLITPRPHTSGPPRFRTITAVLMRSNSGVPRPGGVRRAIYHVHFSRYGSSQDTSTTDLPSNSNSSFCTR